MKRAKAALLICIVALIAANSALGNGGPFVVKYPNGDPAAKGVLARIDPDLKPARETRLRVVKEDLKVTFGADMLPQAGRETTPLAHVAAEYTIENPTEDEITIDFGFPILRGIYVSPYAMMPTPDAAVQLGKARIKSTIISNSAIYGIIRRRAREVIDNAIADNATLADLVKAVRSRNKTQQKAALKLRAGDPRIPSRALTSYLTDKLKWNPRDAALMVEYASLDFGLTKGYPLDRINWWTNDKELQTIVQENLGPLGAIGEQKATQFFAQLAKCFEPEAAAGYEAIFEAWGGDVRERAVDIRTGKVRPRELTIDKSALAKPVNSFGPPLRDLTVYARVDYLDLNANNTEQEKTSCRNILKNLPVIFTFAPMNILYYQAKFQPKKTEKLTVSYRQYAYSDTRDPSTYQLAYVVHPASFWNEFGPINLEVTVPKGIEFKASVPCKNEGTAEKPIVAHKQDMTTCSIYKSRLKSKTGEIFLAVNADSWKKFAADAAKQKTVPKRVVAGAAKQQAEE